MQPVRSSPAKAALSFVVIAGLVALAVWQFSLLRNRAAQELASQPDPAIPKYDCYEGFVTKPGEKTEGSLQDVTSELGIDFQHVVGPLGTYFMPESIGAGVAVFDADQDGRMDLYFANCGQSPQSPKKLPDDVRSENRFFRQLENGRFEDATLASGLGDKGYGAGIAIGDVDNDGWPDVFIANYGQDSLYRNLGQGRFENISSSLNRVENDWGVSGVFFDYDRDGWLDLLVVHYTEDPVYGHSVSCGFQHGLVSYCGPHKFQPTIDRLFRNETGSPANQSKQVTFRDVTEEAGLTAAKSFGFGAICLDLTNDGWPDIFIANDGAENRLWVNQKDGTFREQAQLHGVARNAMGAVEAGMGVATADLNHDGRPDLVITHLTTETATLYLSEGEHFFVDRTEGSGLDTASRSHTGWGVALVDLNHDGVPEIPIVNGLVVPCHSGFPFHGEDQFQKRQDVVQNNEQYWKAYADQNVLLMGKSGMRFEGDSAAGGDLTSAFGSGRSLGYGDLDRDGDVDLIVTNCGGSARYYRNDFAQKGNWLWVDVTTGESKRQAPGAEVTLVFSDDRHVTGFCAPQSSYLASNDARVHFGIGDETSVQRILVRWPDGPVETSVEVFDGGSVNRDIVLHRGTGRQPMETDHVHSLEQ